MAQDAGWYASRAARLSTAARLFTNFQGLRSLGATYFMPTGTVNSARSSGDVLVQADRFFDAMPYPTALFDARGHVQRVNKALCDWMGLNESPLSSGASVESALRVTDQTAVAALGARVDRTLSGAPVPELDLLIKRGDGIEVHARASFTTLRGATGGASATIEGGAVSLVSISPADEASVELVRAKHRYALMADALQDSCIFFLDAEGRVNDWSDSAHRLHGFARAQIIGMPLSALQASVPGEEDELSSQDAVRLACERGQWEVHGWRRRADGHPFWGHVLLTALRDRDGSLEGLSCITRDMTVARDLDKVMNDLNAELERRVSERVRQYAVPNKDLDVFTHHITHDLRGPLRHLNTFAGLIVEDARVAENDELVRYRDGVRTATRRVNAMVEALLDYARIGRADLHPVPLAMASLVQNAIGRVERERPDARVRFVVAGDLPVVSGDPIMLTQLLYSVLDNAVKFSAGQETSDVQIGWRPEGDGFGEFFVADAGVGFDVSKAKNLFVMFARQHHSLEFQGDGTGLAIAQRIVQRHNGRIWADSTPGHGCALYFTLPVDQTLTASALGDLGS